MKRIHRLAGIALLAAVAGCSSSERSPQRTAPSESSAVHIIRSEQLTAWVMDPTDPQRYNRGVRFSPVAAILQVESGGRSYLYCPDAHDAVDDHGGLPAEFDLVAPGDPGAWMPPGYLEAEPGEGFMKIGVGVLEKQKQRYSLFQYPRLLIPAQTSVTWTGHSASFRQTCSGPRGYAYELTAMIQCEGNKLIINWTLTNTGSRRFITRQYIHNFFCFDDRPVGPDYVLRFPYDFQAQGLEAEQEQVGREIRFQQRIPKWVNMVVPYPAAEKYRGPNTVIVEQTQTHQTVTCRTSMPSIRTAIHARPGYVSPEQFIELNLAPHQTATWQRSYTFE